jgi:HEPN domain-containing protein
MTPDELLRDEAAKWLRQAAKDRNAAQILLEAEPSRSVFLSQQAAEKAAKAFLTFHQLAFRKTHDLADLGAQLPLWTQA